MKKLLSLFTLASLFIVSAFVPAGCQSPQNDVDDGTIYNSANADAQPRLKAARTDPVYPLEMKKAGITGKVVFQFIIDRTGAVRDVVILSSPHKAFEKPTIDAVSQWRFSPGIKAGRAVNVRMQGDLTFGLVED
jgi:protein TonB